MHWKVSEPGRSLRHQRPARKQETGSMYKTHQSCQNFFVQHLRKLLVHTPLVQIVKSKNFTYMCKTFSFAVEFHCLRTAQEFPELSIFT